MNSFKRFMGLVWMVVGVVVYIILLKTAIAQVAVKPMVDTIIQWSIFVIIFLPITIGFLIFGWLAFKGAYDKLPVSSEEIEG
jgi:hypothetical protein